VIVWTFCEIVNNHGHQRVVVMAGWMKKTGVFGFHVPREKQKDQKNGECPMKQMTFKNRMIGMISAATIAFCIAWGATPSSAADRVVVIPMGKSGPPAPVAKTGQTTSKAAGDDGDMQKGVGMDAGRFVDNNNGTVTDKLTGLIWLKEGQCTVFFSGDITGVNRRPWTAAVDSANKLASGYCGLADGSVAGEWRLPNVNELSSLLDRGQAPALPVDCPLTDSTFADYYWSSTTCANQANSAWVVYYFIGYVYFYQMSDDNYVRCVRGGQ
jgi:hypothetical protein